MHIPLTFRLVFHGFRAVARASVLFICAWLLLIPANAAEVDALGAEAGTKFPAGLRPMRTARVIVAVAPPYTYTLISNILGPETPAIAVRFLMNQMAAGRLRPPTAQDDDVTPVTTDPGITNPGIDIGTSTDSGRDIAGPRFIKVD